LSNRGSNQSFQTHHIKKAPEKGLSLCGAPGRIIPGVLRYKLLPVICRPGWLTPFNFVPDKISRPAGHPQKTRMLKIVPDDFFEPNDEQINPKQRT
jgi:hypothetical protein